jgi:hypothetical protein
MSDRQGACAAFFDFTLLLSRIAFSRGGGFWEIKVRENEGCHPTGKNPCAKKADAGHSGRAAAKPAFSSAFLAIFISDTVRPVRVVVGRRLFPRGDESVSILLLR